MVVPATVEENLVCVLLHGEESYAIDVENPHDLALIKKKYGKLGGIFPRRSKRLRNLSPTEVEERSSSIPLLTNKKSKPSSKSSSKIEGVKIIPNLNQNESEDEDEEAVEPQNITAIAATNVADAVDSNDESSDSIFDDSSDVIFFILIIPIILKVMNRWMSWKWKKPYPELNKIISDFVAKMEAEEENATAHATANQITFDDDTSAEQEDDPEIEEEAPIKLHDSDYEINNSRTHNFYLQFDFLRWETVS